MKRGAINVGTQTAIKIVKNSIYGVSKIHGDIHIGSISGNELTNKLEHITGVSPWMKVEDIVHAYMSFVDLDRVVKIFTDDDIYVDVKKMSHDGLSGLATIQMNHKEVEEKLDWEKHRGSLVGSKTGIV